MRRTLSSSMTTAAATLALALGGCLALADHGDAWPCSSNADCRADERCRKWGSRGELVCTLASTCSGDADCDAGSICTAGTCSPPICSIDDPSRCQPYGCFPQGRCRTSCVAAGDCAPGNGCQDGQCVPANCDPSAAASCSDYLCREAVCTTGCASSNDCRRGVACIRGKCRVATAIGASCASDKECAAGKCMDGYCGSSHSDCAGASCGWDEGIYCGTCDARQSCNSSGQCADACGSAVCGSPHGVDCGTCASGQYCDSSYQCQVACTAGLCGAHHGIDCGACQAGESCVAGTCGVHEIVVPTSTQQDDGCTRYSAYDGLHEGMIFQATKTVTLLDFARAFEIPPGGATITWTLYESSTQHGTYTRSFMVSNAAAATTTLQTFDAGSVNATLTAGKYYVFEISCVATSATACSSTLAAPSQARAVSFGVPLDFLKLGCSWYYDAMFAYQPWNTNSYFAMPLEVWTSP